MTKQERVDASHALIRWFESWGVTPPDSVEVMAVTIAAMVLTIAKHNGGNPNDAARIIGHMIEETVEEMK
jgi:hypothetical protein